MSKEPIISITIITTLISAVIAALALTWPAVNAYEQPIIAVVAALYPIVTAVWARSRVASPATVASAVAAAKIEPPNTAVVPAVALPGYQAAVAAKLEPVAPGALRFEPVTG